MKKPILIAIAFFVIPKIFCQTPILVWDEIIFNNVKKIDPKRTVINGLDTFIGERYNQDLGPWIEISGRIINKSNQTIYLRKAFRSVEETPVINCYKIEFNYDSIVGYIYPDYIKENHNDLEIQAKSEVKIKLVCFDIFFDDALFNEKNKMDYLNEIIAIIPTIKIISKLGFDNGNLNNIKYYEYKSANIEHVIINWYNYYTFTED
jgi:hypothetical protein